MSIIIQKTNNRYQHHLTLKQINSNRQNNVVTQYLGSLKKLPITVNFLFYTCTTILHQITRIQIREYQYFVMISYTGSSNCQKKGREFEIREDYFLQF